MITPPAPPRRPAADPAARNAACRRAEALIHGPLGERGPEELLDACATAALVPLALKAYRERAAALAAAGLDGAFRALVGELVAADRASTHPAKHRARLERNAAWLAATHAHWPDLIPETTPDLPGDLFWCDGWICDLAGGTLRIFRPEVVPARAMPMLHQAYSGAVASRCARTLATLAETVGRLAHAAAPRHALVATDHRAVERMLRIVDFAALEEKGFPLRFLDDADAADSLARWRATAPQDDAPRVLPFAPEAAGAAATAAANRAWLARTHTHWPALAEPSPGPAPAFAPPPSAAEEPFPADPPRTLFLEAEDPAAILRHLDALRRVPAGLAQRFALLVAPRAAVDAALPRAAFESAEGAAYLPRFLDADDLGESLGRLCATSTAGLSDATFRAAPSAPEAFGRRLTHHLAQVGDVLRARVDRIARANETLYPDGFPASLAHASGSDPLRVLLVTTRESTFIHHCIRHAAEGFRANGCVAEVLVEPAEAPTGMRLDTIAGAIGRFRPHLVFEIDHFRGETAAAIPRNLPFVTWIQDPLDPIMSGERARDLAANDLVLTIFYEKELAAAGYRGLELFPIPVDTAIFDGDPDADDPLHDLSMVNHRPFHAVPLRVNGADISGTALAALAPRFRDDPHACVTLDEYHLALRRALPLAPLESPEAQRLLEAVRVATGSFLCRETAVRWAAELGAEFALYGRGWESHPDFSRFARGPVANGADLARLYNRSRINLHVNPQMTTHPRVFEVIASGGFLLAKRIPGGRDTMPIDRFLPEGDGYLWFETRSEFERLARHFLAAAKERRAIVRRGQARVRSEWNYATRIARLIGIIRARFAEGGAAAKGDA